MKLVAKFAAAVAALAIAVPALACSGEKMQTTEKQQAKPVVASATQKAPAPAKPDAARAQAKPATVQD